MEFFPLEVAQSACVFNPLLMLMGFWSQQVSLKISQTNTEWDEAEDGI
jgi:hypothetical protein